MELANIEKLLEKYLDGNTSIKEECLLKEYFSTNHVPDHLQEYKTMFSFFSSAKEEQYQKQIIVPHKSLFQRKNFKWLSAAAAVLLLFSVYLGNEQYNKHQQKKEAQKIYAQVSKGLQLLSKNLQKGEQALHSLYVYEDTVNKILK